MNEKKINTQATIDIDKFTISLYLLILKTNFRIENTDRTTNTYIDDLEYLVDIRKEYDKTTSPGLLLFDEKFINFTNYFSKHDFNDRDSISKAISEVRLQKELKVSKKEKRLYLNLLDSDRKKEIRARLCERNRWSILFSLIFTFITFLLFASTKVSSNSNFTFFSVLSMLAFSVYDMMANFIGVTILRKNYISTCMFNILFNTKECKEMCTSSKTKIEKEREDIREQKKLGSIVTSTEKSLSKIMEDERIENKVSAIETKYSKSENKFYSLINYIEGKTNKDRLKEMNDILYLRTVFCELFNYLNSVNDITEVVTYIDLQVFFQTALKKINFGNKGKTAFADILFVFNEKKKKNDTPLLKGNPFQNAFNKDTLSEKSINDIKSEIIKNILIDNEYLADYYLKKIKS